ncbi:MAG: non-ribosomal peptide synthetase [Candidatus Acidiferrales bacterium]
MERRKTVADGPQKKLSQLPPDTYLKQLELWNATQQPYSRNDCVPQLVAAHAQNCPSAVALVAANKSLSYGELNSRANRLAHHLIMLGVGPEVLVGLCFQRSIAFVVAALGILKAGGAYLPLDPDYPAERLSLLIKDAGLRFLVTGQCLEAQFRGKCQRVIGLDVEGNESGEPSPEYFGSNAQAQNLAYVIYTSGSTGNPKGVEITHDSLLNLIFWHQRSFGVTASDRASQVAGVGFDAAAWELWPYLTAGASVHIVDEAMRHEPEALRDWIVAQRVTISFMPTPLAERTIALRWPPSTSLRFLLTGADVLHCYPSSNLPFVLVNNYGPTECTVVASSGALLPCAKLEVLPPIGRPIANTQVYILDEKFQRVPIGEVGELYIAGAGLARGYLNRPDLTSERFIPDPFSEAPDQRMYRTGDLASFLRDGQISFHGRIDDQIKLRGFRVEPHEIVSTLNQHETVRASTVVARESEPGEKRLVAYVVPATDRPPTSQALREFLRSRLPEYMVPAAFVRLESLPLNLSGKVDRQALPAPSADNTLRDDSFVAPRTAVEERVTELLAPLLGLEQVGVNDNFFMLGGHSLLGTQLISRIRDTFGIELGLRSLFEAATVKQLSERIEQLLIARMEAMSQEEASILLRAFDNNQRGQLTPHDPTHGSISSKEKLGRITQPLSPA